jgi:hypothetical protein
MFKKPESEIAERVSQLNGVGRSQGGRMTYYKATRTDGTSFHDETTQWKVGRITRIEGKKGKLLCGEGILHASTEPAETLVGGSWPCRLFVVEPRSKVVTDDDHRYKVGAHAWKVVEELPAWQALGPNGQEVAALIERCKTLTKGEARQLFSARDAARNASAWDAARDAAWHASAWHAARDAAWDAAWHAARNASARNASAWDAAWHAARDAAWDAACALIVKDKITAQEFDLLYGPWANVIERATVREDG